MGKINITEITMNNSRTFVIGYLTGVFALVSVVAIDSIVDEKRALYTAIELLVVCAIYIIGWTVSELVARKQNHSK